MSGSGPRRNDGLDLLRAAGAALVFATHLWHQGGLEWLGPVAMNGGVGLYVFFVLSGYLLSRPFLDGPVEIRRYAIARAARLLPGYYLAVVGLAAIGVIPALVANPLPTLTFTANIFNLEPLLLSGFGQSWTLGIELAFYALLPLLVRLPTPAIAAGIVLGYVHLVNVPLGPTEWTRFQLPASLWAFGVGMIAARFVDRVPWRWLGFAGLVCLVAAVTWQYGSLLGSVGTALAIVWTEHARPRWTWARWPADLSYAVYLWHVGVIYALLYGLHVSDARLLLAVPLTVGVAWLSFRYVERPAMRWARCLRPRHADEGRHERAGSARPGLDDAGVASGRLPRLDGVGMGARPRRPSETPGH